ncbi:MAG TPA: glucose 1-dehydrogenase [Polyangia bacterium]|jgi:NAD(P)-dependent dehydrogenase (short-subunit alcohol dehydrogenase family)|nr:glucose 1-dehydrogenase [Polyangia bacterium]
MSDETSRADLPASGGALPAAPRFDLTGQVALVTGAARGIGRGCAIALAQAGADLALGFRDATSGEARALLASIQALGRRALPLQMDVTRRDQIAGATAAAVSGLGRIDVLVNNAGIGPPNPAEGVTEDDFDRTLAVNLKGTFFVSQEVGRAMIRQGGGGRIINLGSQAGFVALPNESIYCMTKAAIAHLTKCLAVEWAVHGITVNAVAPTFIRTPGTVKWLADDDFRRDLLARIPLGRVGDPVDVAGAVVFLASPAASMVTGATLMIDGGWTAR